MKIFIAIVLSLFPLAAHAHWEVDANFVAQHCELATTEGPLQDFTIFYRLKDGVLLGVDRVDVQWDSSVKEYVELDTFRKKEPISEGDELASDLGGIAKAIHNAAFGETRILITATHFDLKIQLRSDHEGGTANVSFVSDGPVSSSYYRCTGVTFP